MADGWNDNYLEQLEALGITCLYHVTDKDNLPSIVKERNLYSWKRLSMNGITVTRPGGNAFTHRLDIRLGMEEAIHLYASEPTVEELSRMQSSGQFSELYVLKVSLKAIHPQSATFWIGDPYSGGKRFDNVRDLSDELSKDPSALSQVRVDIFGTIHINYISNIPKDIWARISEAHPTAIVFVVDQSCSMSRGTALDNVEYDYISDLVAQGVNTQVQSFLQKCIAEDGAISHLYDIAVIGYGNTVSPAWNGELSDRDFHSPMELLSHVKADTDQFRWVDAKDSDNRGRCDLAFEYVYKMLEKWTSREENRFSYPPTVIHISDGDVKREYQKDFLLYAEKLKSLRTETGNVIVWNLSYFPVRFKELVFLSGEELPAFTQFPGGLLLYEASSYLPDRFKGKAATIHHGNQDLARKTMGVNVRLQTLFDALEMCVLPG